MTSGLEIRDTARLDKEQRVANVISKHNCGATDDARQKHKKAVTQTKVYHKLACSNITSLMTSADVGKHNIADDCQQWQDSLREYGDILHQNDMTTLFMIPTEFDINDTTKIKGPYINLLTDFDKISIETACRWQKYLLRCAADVELERTVWAEGVMKYNMNDELKTQVHDSMEETNATGAIVM